MRYRTMLSVLVFLAAASVDAAWAQQRNSAPLPGKDALALEEYRIGPEDVLNISVWKNDPMSRTVPVRPDGMISLPLLDDVRAAGLTPMQLRELLVQKLAEYVPSPSVSVIVSEVRSFKVSVLGEVNRPARYELKSRTTVLDVIALAGGFKLYAARTRIIIIRIEGDGRIR